MMRIFFSTALAAMMTLACSGAMAITPADLSFTVTRDGDAVGTHVVRFASAADGMVVTVDTKVVVRMAMIPVYRFEHHGSEVWRDGKLVGLESETNDDGTHHKLSVTSGPADLVVDGDGTSGHAVAGIIPASLWNRATIEQAALLNTLDGSAMKIRVTDRGPETVPVQGTLRAARHYIVEGDLARELWYDAEGRLVRIRFKAKDDSDIVYALR